MRHLRLTLTFLALALAGCQPEIATNDASLDKDQDGFVNVANGGDDCNDSSEDINPDAEEICDNRDNNCDGLIDCENELQDSDGDGSCICDDCDDKDAKNAPGKKETCDGGDNDCDGFVDCVDSDMADRDGDGACVCNDCDDRDDKNFPSNSEVCDGQDNDCDDKADNGLTFQDWYQDIDGDGHGDPATLQHVCSGPPGSNWVLVGDDCDDNDDRNFPNNNEACDNQDNDCDNQVDENLAFLNLYNDTDGDGWGDDNDTVYTCPGLAGSSYVVFRGDCDDNNDQVAPDKTEVCDGIDNDCDGLVDCADPQVPDADADGACICTDCDDKQGWNFPGNPEICDGQDNDCNNDVDCDDSALADADGDGACVCTDCDDNDAANAPANAEICDGGDNDCDGKVDCADPGVDDDDGDGVCVCQDCDDVNDENYPGNRELCDGADNDCDTVPDNGLVFVDWYADVDGDGRGDGASLQTLCDGPPAAGWVQNGDDCDDNDPANFPGNVEICDGADNDCDTVADNNLSFVDWYNDVDGDNRGDPATQQTTCDGPPAAGWVQIGDDCDDNDPANFPTNLEVCDGADNDCDTVADDNLIFADWFADTDGDGRGDGAVQVNTCDGPPAGVWVRSSDDCDDNDAANFPGNLEVCDGADNDCDTVADDNLSFVDWYADADGDGRGDPNTTASTCDGPPAGVWVQNGNDCDDADANNFPGNVESCDGIDNDCDTTADEGLPFADWFADADGDGRGDPATVQNTCDGPPAVGVWVQNGADCDDADSANFPGNLELCDNADNNCDNIVDNNVSFTNWYADNDGDGRGDASTVQNTCDGPPAGVWVTNANDCDDNDANNFPGNVESCDGVDNDCDTTVDEGLPFVDWYLDDDGDGRGDAANTQNTCDGPPNVGVWVRNSDDCDDADSANFPGNVEVCDNRDNDCDTVPDNGIVFIDWYADVDGDGRGDAGTTQSTCDGPPTVGFWVQSSDDCDDFDANNFPGNVESCDGVDNDCDTTADEGLPFVDWYADVDGDGRGDAASVQNTCDGPPVGVWVQNGTDCDDADSANFPGNVETCDGADNNCDTNADEGLPFVDWYFDSDGDGRGDPATLQNICNGPPAAGWVQVGDDCDDADATNYPTNNEACDNQDNDCDTLVDEGVLTQTLYQDIDGDTFGDPGVSQVTCLGGVAGFVSRAGDCDDGNSAINPAADEVCNSIDDDCDTFVDCNDSEVQDADADGFCVCDDCDDLALWNFPGNPEICDGEDNDCDGLVDCADGDVPDGDNDGSCSCDDCDDGDVLNFPGNAEMCDGQDNDCDTFVDCTDSDVPDSDSDGVCECIDCDDANITVFPGNLELCDGIDSDCDGNVPANETVDGDGDGFVVCDDCDDTNPASNPTATEICDGQDNDCDGNLPADEVDADKDGHWQCEDCDDLDPAVWVGGADTDGDGYSECAGDCAPSDPAINPSATEVCDYLDNNCDGAIDESFVTAGSYEQEANCGFCGNDCASYNFANATPFCDPTPAIPECAPSCANGFFDANADYGDGCECQYIGPSDRPFDGTDEDCNGDDGDHATAIHVALWGRNNGDGSIGDPVRTVQDGIDLAVNDGLSFVLVSEGTYAESVVLDPSISLVGGYSFYFDSYDSAIFETIIDGRATTDTVPGSITLTCGGQAQRIQGFTVYGTVPDDPGESSYGVHATDCENTLELADNIITSRTGAAGSLGAFGGHGVLGTDGADGVDADFTSCNSTPLGGTGGATTCTIRPESIDGGDGGDQVCPILRDQYALPGADGLGGAPGIGGDPGGTCEFAGGGAGCGTCTITATEYGGPGFTGTRGGVGASGTGGSGCNTGDGQVVGGLFVGSTGAQGADGFNGSGGGGGGGGGAAQAGPGCGSDAAGGTGGGGGSGGCGAEGGFGGTGGGGSFGLFLVYTSNPPSYPVLTSNLITSGPGGVGGAGGVGGVGGAGGLGGVGGLKGDGNTSILWAASAGGDGGNGGAGGHGGGGGGGCGGASYALYVAGANPAGTYGNSSTLTSVGGGAGGPGGYGPGGTSGNVGATGASGGKNF